MTPLPRTARSCRRLFVVGLFAMAACLGGRRAKADPIYTITDLGTLPGMNSSVATAINNAREMALLPYPSQGR